jgi:hypothetical protein
MQKLAVMPRELEKKDSCAFIGHTTFRS